jgi:CheY-like chemotaxis protein
MADIEQPAVALPPKQTYRILTLENPENVEKLKLACKLAGHQVVPCFTITEAMQFLETKDHVDVIVAAAHLQNESVFNFLQKVKNSDCILHKAQFFMLCADPGMLALVTSPSVEIAATLMGADKYLLMPEFDAEKLMEEIEKLFPAVPYKEITF